MFEIDSGLTFENVHINIYKNIFYIKLTLQTVIIYKTIFHCESLIKEYLVLFKKIKYY